MISNPDSWIRSWICCLQDDCWLIFRIIVAFLMRIPHPHRHHGWDWKTPEDPPTDLHLHRQTQHLPAPAGTQTHSHALALSHTPFKCVCAAQSLLSSLLIDQPDDPIDYLIRVLERNPSGGKWRSSIVAVVEPASTWWSWSLTCSSCCSVSKVVLLGPPAVGKRTLVSVTSKMKL